MVIFVMTSLRTLASSGWLEQMQRQQSTLITSYVLPAVINHMQMQAASLSLMTASLCDSISNNLLLCHQNLPDICGNYPIILRIKLAVLFYLPVQRVTSVAPMPGDLGGVMKRQCRRNEWIYSINQPPLGSDTLVFRGTRPRGKDHSWEIRWVFLVEDNETKSSCTPEDKEKKNDFFFWGSASPNVKSGGCADHIGIGRFSLKFPVFTGSLSSSATGRLQEEETVFINAIHPLWIAAATTEKPGDTW